MAKEENKQKENKIKNINIKTPWDQKYLREQPFMAFGSMMNAYGRINESSKMNLVEFEMACNYIFQLAKRFTEESFASAEDNDDNSVDIPIKKKSKKDE